MKLFESQDKKNSRKRMNVRLSSRLEKNLLAYAAAAGAAGVSILASSQAAEAKIVYTPANSSIGKGGSIALDLNHDGIVDYNLTHWAAASVGGSLQISYLLVCHELVNGFSHQCVSSTNLANAQNVVRTVTSGAAALPLGASIRPGEQFGGAGVRVVMGGRDFYYPGSYHPQKWYGPWVNGGAGVTNRYLGFKFKIGSQFHFGWARLTVTTTPKNGFSTVLTGYAYETIPGKGIRAGKTSGTDEVAGVNINLIPAEVAGGTSLGSLALGEAGLSIWRRKEPTSN